MPYDLYESVSRNLTEFRGFMFLFGTFYVALFNGLMISDIRILVTHVYCLLRCFYLNCFPRISMCVK